MVELKSLLSRAVLLGSLSFAMLGVVRAEERAPLEGERAFKRAPGHVSVAGPTINEYYAKQSDLHNWLMAEVPLRALNNVVEVNLTTDEVNELADVDVTQPGPLKVGLVKELDEPVVVSLRASDATRGVRGQRAAKGRVDESLEMTDDGGFVWAQTVTSPGAVALRVQVTNLSLPADADLYIMNLDGEAYGPIQATGPNGDGEVWMPSIMGDTGILVLRHFGPNGAADLKDVSMTISAVGHIGSGFPGAGGGNTAAFCAFNESCVENASCENTGPATAARDAAAKMLWVAGCCINICSGGLIADTDSGSEIPYFLTANHCISKGNAANNLEAFFQYSVNCGAGCPAGSFEAPPAPKTSGSTIRATGRSGDFTLLELDQQPPSGSVYLGWDNTPIAFSNGASLHRIAHPAGAPQAYSEHAVDTGAGTCTGWPRGERIYSADVVGATEGGSSGSPVVNANGDIVGQLSGCCGFNCGDVCDTASNSTVDGALAYYFSSVEPYLDPGTPSCDPSETSCSNGVDDDCDGQTDCNDSDCSADPACQSGGSCVNPGGAPAGASCSSDAECCDNKCKGPPNNQTCR